MENISLLDLDKAERIELVHTIAGIKSPFLVGTISNDGYHNLGLFSQVFHVGSSPPLIGIKVRPVGSFSHTYKNLQNHSYATLNMVTEDTFAQAHLASARLDKEQSEYDYADLSVWWSEKYRVPGVTESPIISILEKVEELPVQSNGVIILIMKIVDVWITHTYKDLKPLSYADMGGVAVQGLSQYYNLLPLRKLVYAHRPKK